MEVRYKFNSLEDFLITHPFTVDGSLDDGWGAKFPVKGIEIDATILFADISGFSRRTATMGPVETLIFVNNFFAWITAEALRGEPCIVDKYIGDEVMVLYSREFGSSDPFVDAVRAARRMIEKDVLGYRPHIGIASGKVFAGYVGTPFKYSASLFGTAVTLAARCVSVRADGDKTITGAITFPAEEWADRNVDEVLPPEKRLNPQGNPIERPQLWRLSDVQDVGLKNIGEIAVRQLVTNFSWFSEYSAEERAIDNYKVIREAK